MAEQTGQLQDAEARLEEATEATDQGEATPQQRSLAKTYVASNRANISLARGRYTEALEQAEAHRQLAEAAHLPDQLREAALNAAIAHVRMGNVNEAASALQRLDEWCTMSGDRRVGALVKVFVGELLRRSGDLPQAKRAGLNALESATECGHAVVLAEAELALAEAYAAQGQLDDAGHRFTKCIDRAARLAYRRHDVAGRLGLARVAARQGDRDAAKDIDRVRSTAAELGYEDLEADALLASAELLPPEDAEQASRRATKLARAAGYFWGEIAGLLAQGEAQLALGALDKAVASLKQAARLKLRRTHARQGAMLYARERELRRALVKACRAAGESALLGAMARLQL
jgi:tetratricopeptide (TPR) repeat protein